MESAMRKHQRQIISKFQEIAVGQTEDIATQFLKATCWKLEDAINLFLTERTNQALMSYEEEQINLPLPSVKDTLYDSSLYNTSVSVCPEEIWNSDPEQSDSGTDLRLSSLYRAPLNLLFDGSFEEAKRTSSREDQWLLVNLQSTTEFASHTLNRDLWSNDAVSQAIKCSFVLLQVYDHTDEGKKISTFYKIGSAPPIVLLIDPITGQKMRTWSGVIDPQSFLEDLMKYIDDGPHEHIASMTSNKRIKTEKICFSSNQADQDMASFWDKDFDKSAKATTLLSHKKKETCSSTNHAPSLGQEFEDQVVASSSGSESEEENFSSSNYSSSGSEFEESAEVKEEQTCPSSNNTSSGHEFEETMTLPEHEDEPCLEEFPVLTEEPKEDCDRSLVCSLCVRFPDGRRKQRKFLKSEPIQLLWSFCYSHMEKSDKKEFKLVQAIPGTTKTLEYKANVTFDESGLANWMISVTWE
ncbi:putative plant UBX domain-containing protein 14 [Cardamine amara subsp. amara]|uniref:Plant UBX domain-containing protein 14 n=1 Tax=Cardamine amara subsp. amara TaxID=228776 RepID=A0ABD1A372_CARAN